MKMNSVNLILHAHLPYVRHLEYPRFLEEDWLFESLNETYIPLLRMLEKLVKEKVKYKLTICFSPTLCTMLTDQALLDRFVAYMHLHEELGIKEVDRTYKEDPAVYSTACSYLDEIQENLRVFESYDRDILKRFKMLQDRGYLEIITTAATHAYLPLYRNYETAIRAQIDTAIKTHERIFGISPQGFWLPECGYYPGLEKILSEYGIQWIQLSASAPMSAKNKIPSAGYLPLDIGSGVVGFARDWNLTSLIWSDTFGYPCDGDYREFYRDIGYDLPMDYIKPYIHEPEVRVFTGFKYWAVTGKTNEKKVYNIVKANEKVALHVDNLIYHIKRKGMMLDTLTENGGFFNLCFDAELFGHRWYEGIQFLEGVLRKAKDENIELTTPISVVNDKNVVMEKAELNESSWAPNGFSDTWLDGSNAWVYRHTQNAIECMEELTERFPNQSSLRGRFLNQAAREILLAMASDWPYIMYDRTSVTYAENRLRNHLGSFHVVYSNMCKNAVNTEWLIKSEKRNAIFPDMDYNIFKPKKH